jgi:hypothetical protein
MSPDQPGAPPSEVDVAGAGSSGGAEAGVRPPRFRADAERVDESTGSTPKAPAPSPRRRFLDDPDPDGAPRPKRPPKVRARKVRRVVRHIEPWSVLKISVLFFLSLFLIICVASAVLWNTARSAGAIDDVESFITSLGFGNCEDIAVDPATTGSTTPSTIDGAADQLGAGDPTDTTVAAEDPIEESSTLPDEDGKCREGQRLVGGFRFEDERIFQAFGLGGVVLVLFGSAAFVVMALLFNLISDLTGGVRVTVLEEDPPPRVRPPSGSPPPEGRG